MNKICSHTQKRICLQIQKTHRQIAIANFIGNGKFLPQILTANSHGKFLRQVPMANSCGKFPRQILAANSHGKFLRQILEANSYGKFRQKIPKADSLIYNVEDSVEYPLCKRASHVNIKRKQVTIASEMVKIS